ncbi:hypothetical protein [Nakamurella aerolata]|uniref:Uncharacterized protein n=1 Tax=Nakamurella aerolata TaxID=1656892 RepID=A0A849A523_9ACTN|nr:hypothetical protein [Nakamurella aerolata]NNG35659.1 hypothetical protein [Nakamurella aerolata]
MPGKVLLLVGRRLGRLIGLAADATSPLSLLGFVGRGQRRNRPSLYLEEPAPPRPAADPADDVPERFRSRSAGRGSVRPSRTRRQGQPVGKRQRRPGDANGTG